MNIMANLISWKILGNSLHNTMRILTNLRSFAVAIVEIFIP